MLVFQLCLSDFLAKTFSSEDNKIIKGRNIFDHCFIVGLIAKSLMKRFPVWLQDFFPKGTELIAAIHDIGKVYPFFQRKLYEKIESKPDFFYSLENFANYRLEKNWGYHAGVGAVTINAFCSTKEKYISKIVGQHHGFFPNISQYSANCESFGGQQWQEIRELLIRRLKQELKVDFPEIIDDLHARIISGLVSVADWIGSGDLFENPENDYLPNIEKSLNLAGFINTQIRSDLSFENIFGFQPYDLQNQFIQYCDQRGVYILEAPMGIGKTEAALYAAYKVLSKQNATGIYFALPTQLTSDKIKERMDEFLKKIVICGHNESFLAHCNAWLKESEIGGECLPGKDWFQYSKRKILAPFAVGTIDQVLMSVMHVKYGFIRTFGLMGKVVILDEVHTYDAYTGTILEELIQDLRNLRCTIIILSATLTGQRRKELLKQDQIFKKEYPLISYLQKDDTYRELSCNSLEDVDVKFNFCFEDFQAINEALKRAEEGQQVLWIENTVKEAQDIYKLLSARANSIGNVSCGLLHSRFLKCDRAKTEEKWVKLLGKNSIERHKQGRILIGTQILEQSLDIDADFLVTRICPTDFLLQRVGRLWRHKETVRPQKSIREVVVLSSNIKEPTNVEKDFGKTGIVYSPYVLYHTFHVLKNIRKLKIPRQIPELIEATYEDQVVENKFLMELKAQLENEKNKLKGLARIGISKNVSTLPECKASTRCFDVETVDVLLLRNVYFNDDNSIEIEFLDGKKISLFKNDKNQKKLIKKKLAISLMNNILNVPASNNMYKIVIPKELNDQYLSYFENYLYVGSKEHEENILRIAKVDKDNSMFNLDGSGVLATYDSFIGYQILKRTKIYGK